MSISARVSTRISTELKRYQSVLASAKQRDISEADTSAIVSDILANVLGYDKYHHITREHAIRGTYVDFAVVVEDEIRFLIEVKAIGVELKDAHIKQAIDYGANKGIEWVILTNGAVWRAYKLVFAQPIDKILVFELDLLAQSPRSTEVLECLGGLSREGFSQPSMTDLLRQKQVTSKFTIAAVLMGDGVIEALRREIRRLAGVRVDADYLRHLLSGEIIKRELIDSEDATSATALVKKLQRELAREKKRALEDDGPGPSEPTEEADADASHGSVSHSLEVVQGSTALAKPA